MEEGRFPRSTLSKDGKGFTLKEIEVDTFERPKSTRTRSIRFLYVTDAENSFCHLLAFHLVSILPRILRIQSGEGWRSRTLDGKVDPLARSGLRSPIVVGSSPSRIAPMAATSPGKAEPYKRWPRAPLWDDTVMSGIPRLAVRRVIASTSAASP